MQVVVGPFVMKKQNKTKQGDNLNIQQQGNIMHPLNIDKYIVKNAEQIIFLPFCEMN